MKKYLKSVILILIVISVAGCSDLGSMELNEQNAPVDPYKADDLSALQRINDIKNGAKPVVKPTGDTSQSPAAPAQPPMPKTTPPAKPAAPAMPQLDDLKDEYSHAIIKTSMGDITVELYGEDSPLTVNNFLNLARDGFYDGVRFHRVIKDFMIQSGDPLSKDIGAKDRWGTGGPGYKFKDEINDHPLQKGSLAMANAGPDTNGSQFFIVTAAFTPWLDGKHTNFGFVTEGLDVVEAIEAVETDPRDRPAKDVIINSIELLK